MWSMAGRGGPGGHRHAPGKTGARGGNGFRAGGRVAGTVTGKSVGAMGGLEAAGDTDLALIMDRAFDFATLAALRADAHTALAGAGLPLPGATDFVIAMHELAANAVRHGGGHGQARIWRDSG